ncbi:hypothetical protein NL676_026756 [Syzygium grande]|nr:hypothetical protein NL676_026756 [Syzygium grande]
MAGAASDNEARDVEPNTGGVASGGPSSPVADNFNRRWSIFNWFGPVTNGTAGASNAEARAPLTAFEAPPHPTPIANNLNRRCGSLDWVRGACLLASFILSKLKILKLLEFLAFAVIVEEVLGQNSSLRVVGILLRRLGTTLKGSRD